jgi:lipopolysaccharide transport system permease protein
VDHRRRLLLVWQLARREVEARYRGSSLGLLWSIANPLMMLAVFTFVFAVVFQARWGQENASTLSFAIITFAGLIIFNLFSEVALKSPTLITSQPNLVKKVVFPLAILPLVVLTAALFHAAIALTLLLVVQAIFNSGFHTPALTAPLLLLPLMVFSLGLSWFLAALGVYLRDIGQIVSPLITMLMFLSPIFYPIEALPDWMRPMATLNPLAMTIEQVRGVLIFGKLPDMSAWALSLALAGVFAAGGFAFFRRVRNGFADVL